MEGPPCVGRGSGWSGEWTAGGGTAELEIWAQAWGCVCEHTHTPPHPQGTQVRRQHPCGPARPFCGVPPPRAASDLLCVPAVAGSKCDFGPGPLSPGLLVPFVLQGLRAKAPLEPRPLQPALWWLGSLESAPRGRASNAGSASPDVCAQVCYRTHIRVLTWNTG